MQDRRLLVFPRLWGSFPYRLMRLFISLFIRLYCVSVTNQFSEFKLFVFTFTVICFPPVFLSHVFSYLLIYLFILLLVYLFSQHWSASLILKVQSTYIISVSFDSQLFLPLFCYSFTSSTDLSIYFFTNSLIQSASLILFVQFKLRILLVLVLTAIRFSGYFCYIFTSSIDLSSYPLSIRLYSQRH